MATTYRPVLMSYDYHKDRDYRRVHAQLRAWGAVKILESTWLGVMLGRASDIRNILMTCGDGDESFFVIELPPGGDWATFGVPEAANQWLSDNIAFAVDG